MGWWDIEQLVIPCYTGHCIRESLYGTHALWCTAIPYSCRLIFWTSANRRCWIPPYFTNYNKVGFLFLKKENKTEFYHHIQLMVTCLQRCSKWFHTSLERRKSLPLHGLARKHCESAFLFSHAVAKCHYDKCTFTSFRLISHSACRSSCFPSIRAYGNAISGT